MGWQVDPHPTQNVDQNFRLERRGSPLLLDSHLLEGFVLVILRPFSDSRNAITPVIAVMPAASPLDAYGPICV